MIVSPLEKMDHPDGSEAVRMPALAGKSDDMESCEWKAAD